MIQRIQTLYLAILILLVSIVSTGTSLFSFISETSKFTFSSFGITEYSLDGKFIQTETFPIFVGTIALVLLSFLCLMSYKNINRQFKLGRLVFFIYFLSLLSIFLLSVFGDRLLDVSSSSREMGVGYFLFIAGFPFSFLANIGIKRDKKLLDSLDRLR
ncbi:MAG: DUF4293 family protein [Crocinitomicaceae bacterium]|nr:DUF4293 family protein [Crocinitomicaceae bacterium]MDG1741914.1 DUF4293 family protein [Crocinitomicaceae bacterium]